MGPSDYKKKLNCSIAIAPCMVEQFECENCGAYLEFDATSDPVVEVRVGISMVSLDQARQNAEAQVLDRTFEQVHQEAVDLWNCYLNRIQIEGGTEDQRRLFYTSLYRIFMQPADYTEASGEFFSAAGGVGERPRPGLTGSGPGLCRGLARRLPGALAEAIDLPLEARHLEDPFLPGHGLEGAALVQHQHHVARRHQHQLRERVLDSGKYPPERSDAPADPLHRDPRLQEALRGLQGHEVAEAVAAVTSPGARRRANEIGLRPVLKLTSRDSEDLRDFAAVSWWCKGILCRSDAV